MAKPGPAQGEKRAIFLALREGLRRELATGRSMKAVYVTSGASEAMSYALFARYVARYLPKESEVQRWSAGRSATTASATTERYSRAAAPPPAATPLPPVSASQEHRDLTPKGNKDGPILPPPRPEPRRFIRLAGLPDDNKDYLLGPAEPPASGRKVEDQ
jgi:hypothetical protein